MVQKQERPKQHENTCTVLFIFRISRSAHPVGRVAILPLLGQCLISSSKKLTSVRNGNMRVNSENDRTSCPEVCMYQSTIRFCAFRLFLKDWQLARKSDVVMSPVSIWAVQEIRSSSGMPDMWHNQPCPSFFAVLALDSLPFAVFRTFSLSCKKILDMLIHSCPQVLAITKKLPRVLAVKPCMVILVFCR